MSGWLLTHLGYGTYGLIDSDNPNNPPSVSASITAPTFDTFTRICQEQFNNTEEVRRMWDSINGFEYVALAPSGTPTSVTTWKAVRVTWTNSQKTRLQYQENISWDNITQGWPS